MTNLATKLVDTAAREGHRPAVRLDDLVVSYAELDDRSARVAGWLRSRGVGSGDRVGIMLPNVIEFAVLYYGALRSGATVVPMNPLLKSREVQHYLGDSASSLVFASSSAMEEASIGAARAGTKSVRVDSAFMEQIAACSASRDVVPRSDDDTAVILYTSGTTGTPKGAELTHANMQTNAAVTATALLALSPDDIVMGCLPLFHSFGQTCGLNAAVLAGACVTLMPRFDAASALQVIERDRVTVFEGVPTMYAAMLHAGAGAADTSSLRICVSGGAALPVEVLRGFAETFGAPILEGYGLSETSPVASFNRLGNAKAGSIGYPIEGVEMRVLDRMGGDMSAGEVGEIAIRGHNVMKGYWRRPDATADAIRGGWFHTGDLGMKDRDGFFYIVDRKKDMIIRGGFNVYPREIEEVLYEHPAVLEAAVIGLPHGTHGEEVGAAVALRPGSVTTSDELRDYVKERVAAYKYPRHVWLVDALPKGPTGKILKRKIVVPAGVGS